MAGSALILGSEPATLARARATLLFPPRVWTLCAEQNESRGWSGESSPHQGTSVDGEDSRIPCAGFIELSSRRSGSHRK